MPDLITPPLERLLQSEVLSGASSVILDQGIDAGLAFVDIILPDIFKSVNENYLYLEASTDGGSSWLAGTTYAFQVLFAKEGNVNAAQNSLGTTLMKIGGRVGGGGNAAYGATIRIFDPANTSYYKNVNILGSYGDNAPTSVVNSVGGLIRTTSAINAFRITPQSGTITGNVKMTGRNK